MMDAKLPVSVAMYVSLPQGPPLNHVLTRCLRGGCPRGSLCSRAQDPQPAPTRATCPVLPGNFFKGIIGEIEEFFENVTRRTILSFFIP